MKSIRRRLLITILAVLFLLTILLAAATYFSLRHEMDELYDGNMKQVAELLARTGIEDDVLAIDQTRSPRFKSAEQFLIQIWQDDNLRYSSHPAIHFPRQNAGGFADVMFEGKKWRYFSLMHGSDTIQTAQNVSGRRDVIGEIYQVIAWPIIFQFPIVAGLIWVLVNYGLAPLGRISDLIHRRSSRFLDPLPVDNIPVELGVFVSALNDLLQRLQAALQAQRQLTADAAHELRTPLTAVKLQLDMVNRALNEDDKAEMLATLEKGVERSIRLVQQLLELARNEPDQVEWQMEDADLKQIIDQVVEQEAMLANSKSIKLIVQSEPALVITANAPQMITMITNVVHNALIYTPAGGLVKINARRNNEQIILDIEDNGIGINEDERRRIFDRFYRATGTGVTGSGLGLSIVKNIADFHNIGLGLHTGADGKGIKFRFIFNVS